MAKKQTTEATKVRVISKTGSGLTKQVDLSKPANLILCTIIALFALAMIGVGLLNMMGVQFGGESHKPNKSDNSKANLILTSHEIDRTNPYAVFVNGYVNNNGGKAISSYAQISFDALDSDGANIGTCLANTNVIDAWGKWKFSAMCPADTATARFNKVVGY